MLDTGFAVGSALVAVAFAMATFERVLDRRRRHEAAFCLAFVLFAAAAAALAAGSAAGWTPAAFRLFYLCGGVLDVPVLAVGTIYLHAGRRTGDITAVAVALGGAFASGILVATPLTHRLPAHALAQGSKVFGALPQVLAGVGSGVGSIVIVAGALVSAFRLRRGPRPMVVGNVLLAVGVLVTGAGGLLNSVADQMTGFSVALAVGVAILFAGYLLVTGGGRPAVHSAPAALHAAPDDAAAADTAPAEPAPAPEAERFDRSERRSFS